MLGIMFGRLMVYQICWNSCFGMVWLCVLIVDSAVQEMNPVC